MTTAHYLTPKLDPGFMPAAIWNREYRKRAAANHGRRPMRIAVERPDGTAWLHESTLLPNEARFEAQNWRYAERLLKCLLWAQGGSRLRIAGAPELVKKFQQAYAPGGERAFDFEFFNGPCFGSFAIEAAHGDELAAVPPKSFGGANPLKGNRIGFDLGGSDRKCAALIDGEVVFSEEIKWSPYFESDPEYHRSGIADSLKRAAAHLPHVDAIGGSAAGVYIDNEPRVGSLFRGVDPAQLKSQIRPIFKELQKEWGGIPFEVANDGDVTAIAGSMAIQDNAVLGISMGTSLAAGYVDPQGLVTGWLNELAFVPVDYRSDAPADEWSGDIGCGVQYFSQQAVGRLLPLSGIQVEPSLGLPEKLEVVQAKMADGDERAAAIYETIGTYFGYSIAHYADFYSFRHLLVLGRVSSGRGGDLILETARKVLNTVCPEESARIAFQAPDEKTKRHGQAIAAASLPRI